MRYSILQEVNKITLVKRTGFFLQRQVAYSHGPWLSKISEKATRKFI